LPVWKAARNLLFDALRSWSKSISFPHKLPYNKVYERFEKFTISRYRLGIQWLGRDTGGGVF